MSGTNAFKRGVQDQRLSKRITDSRTGRAFDTFPEEENTQQITSNGQDFIQVLPTEQQSATDPVQLKAYPQYRLIRQTQTENGGDEDCGEDSNPFVDCDLNPDVTEFLALLNDIGLRIFKITDPDNFGMIINARSLNSREIVEDKAGLDTVSSNILILMDKMRDFLYDFGKKIAPPGVNPYLNNEKLPAPVKEDDCKDDCKQSKVTNINVSSGSNPGVMFPGPPYNPNDVNTFLNCLDNLIDDSTESDDTVDFNLTVFQSIIQNSKVTKFDDAVIDEYQVTREQPNHNMMTMMLTLLKIDIKFMSILYDLNLHDAFRSPITGAKYGKPRTRINMNGVPVPNNEITNTDIFNATRELKAMLACIIQLITFVKIDGFNKIMIDHFAWDPEADPQPVPAPDDIEIIVDESASNIPGVTMGDTNIPCFMYGQILSFCDVARLILADNNLPFPSANTNPDVTFNELYEPSKVATIAVNSIYGMKAVMQLIETLLKSDAYLTVLGMIFPSGRLHEGVRDFDPLFKSDRMNEIDYQSLNHLSIFGTYEQGKTIPTTTVPNAYGSDPLPICIDKIFFCDIYNSHAGISNMLWDSGAPFITKFLFEDQGLYDPEIEFVLPTTAVPTTSAETTSAATTSAATTSAATTTAVPTTNAPTTVASTTVAGTTVAGTTVAGTTVAPTTSAGTTTELPPLGPGDVFMSQPGIIDLIEMKARCVFTLSDDGRVICPLDDYIKAYADYVREQYNIIAAQYEQPRDIRQTRRNVFNMVTSGIRFQ
jgi:hypothetical protein